MAFTLDNPLVQTYIFYSVLLTIKVLIMAMLTAKVRYGKKVFPNEEDAKSANVKVKFADPDVERVRRAHRNDLENIPAFWILCALYLTTDPAVWLTTQLIRVFAVSRILHTYVYVINPLPQPARALAFMFPTMINYYFGVNTLLHYANAW